MKNQLQEINSLNSQWIGKCFVCKKKQNIYSPQNLLCLNCHHQYRSERYFLGVQKLEECFVSIFPELDEEKMKQICDGPFSDLFLTSGEKNLTNIHHPFEQEVGGLKDRGLTCGQPVCTDITSLATFSGFGEVVCLDLSQYLWSGTLKDLKNWAILSIAVEKHVENLALWTAGNAGISLAKFAHRWNAKTKDNKITVYCLVSAFAPPEIIVNLRAHGCRVAPVATGTGLIIFRDQIKSIVESLGASGRYWHVTDGWDGLGVFMYRLLCRQTIAHLRPDYVVVPVGTGSLLAGFYLGCQDMNDAQQLSCKLVGALPYGDNVVNPLRQPSEENARDKPRVRRVPPVAPKLTGFYSPLAPCLWYLLENRAFADPHWVEFIEVDKAQQIEVGAEILSPTHETGIASEPSALIAFGALKRLKELVEHNSGNPIEKKVLIVNSGLGLMSDEDEELYTKSIFRFR